MKNLKSVLVLLFLMIFLIGCASNPERIVETRYPQMPSVYLEKCDKTFEDSTIKSVLLGLDKTVRCYEGKQESLKNWHKDLTDNKDDE